MSLPDVLLSLLREPMCGTDLVDVFRTSIGHFWNADLSQVYRALESLEEKGCVRSKSVPSPKGPARRVYSLTAAGKRRLVQWIEREPRLPPMKVEYLAQLFSVTAAEKPARRARELLAALRDDARASLAILEGIDGVLSEVEGYPDRLPSHVYYPWLTLRHGLHRRRALVTWIEESLDSLRRRGSRERPASEEEFGDLMAMLRSMGVGVAES